MTVANKTSSVKLTSLGNFFGYVYSIMFLGLGIVIATATGMGFAIFNLYTINVVFFIICMIVIICGSLYIENLLASGIKSNSVTKSFMLFLICSILIGMQLSPVFAMGFIYKFNLIVYSLGLCSMFFLLLSLFAFFSSKTFTPLKNVLITGSVLLLFLGIIKMIIYLFNPELANKIDLFESIIGIALSVGFVLYNISSLKDLYIQFNNYESNRSVMNLGIIGALMLLKTFVTLFLYILKFMLRMRKNNNNNNN